jgi:hypothetical protein
MVYSGPTTKLPFPSTPGFSVYFSSGIAEPDDRPTRRIEKHHGAKRDGRFDFKSIAMVTRVKEIDTASGR